MWSSVFDIFIGVLAGIGLWALAAGIGLLASYRSRKNLRVLTVEQWRKRRVTGKALSTHCLDCRVPGAMIRQWLEDANNGVITHEEMMSQIASYVLDIVSQRLGNMHDDDLPLRHGA